MRTHTHEEKNAAVHAIWLAAYSPKKEPETFIRRAAKLLRTSPEGIGERLKDFEVASVAFNGRPPNLKPEDSLRQITPVTVSTD